MGERVDLPGGWAVIKDPAELTNRDRKMLRRGAIPARGLRAKVLAAGIETDDAKMTDADREAIGEMLSADDLDLTDAAQAAFIVAYVAEWSYGPLPTLDSVDDLPGPVYDALATATMSLGDGTVDTTVDGALDPGSPTVPSPA